MQSESKSPVSSAFGAPSKEHKHQRTEIEPWSTEPNIVLCLVGYDKTSAAFLVGSLVALARLGWLSRVRAISASGVGVMVVSMLLDCMQRHCKQGFAADRWGQLLNAFPADDLLARVVAIGDTNHEWEALWSRLWKPAHWRFSWHHEFALHLRHTQTVAGPRTTVPLVSTSKEFGHRVMPVVVWNTKSEEPTKHHAVAWTNQDPAPVTESSIDGIRWQSMARHPMANDLCLWSAALGASGAWFGDARSDMAANHESDPMGWQAAQLLYTTLNLGGLKRDRSDRTSNRREIDPTCSQRGILVDAFTGSHLHKHKLSASTQLHCLRLLAEITSAPDIKFESMRLVNKTAIQCHDASFAAQFQSVRTLCTQITNLDTGRWRGFPRNLVCGVAQWGYVCTIMLYAAADARQRQPWNTGNEAADQFGAELLQQQHRGASAPVDTGIAVRTDGVFQTKPVNASEVDEHA